MKRNVIQWIPLLALAACGSTNPAPVQEAPAPQPAASTKHMYVDVHDLEPGKVKFDEVMGAHQKDLAVQDKHGVKLARFWVDEAKGKVYCLSTSDNPDSIYNMHKEAHGLTPSAIYEVSGGQEAAAEGDKPLYLDVHEMGAGKVNAKAVAEAHVKDLAVQGKYGVNLLNYWVDEKEGKVFCLAEAKDSTDLIKTHKEAHGLLPSYVMKVKEGQ